MSRRDDLEATLFDDGAWNLDQLAVYADELQLCGDLRGELIALDLDLHDRQDVELAARHRAILGSLLGDRATDPAIRCRYGFVELELDDASNVDVIAGLGPFARHVSAVRIEASAPVIAAAIDALAITPRPWLTTLDVCQRGPGPSPIVRTRSVAALAAAAPRLDTVELTGTGVFASFAHPTVRRLRLTGVDAVRSLTNAAPLLPGVRELDLRFHAGLDGGGAARGDDEWVRYLPPVQLPALRRLDLDRNAPATGAGELDSFRFVRTAPIAPQLTHLRWPELRTAGDLANAQAALDRMDRLVAVEAPPGPRLAKLHHRGAAICELRRSWRPLSRTSTRFVVDRRSIRVQFAEAAAWLDDHYDRIPAEARAAWDSLWDVLLRQPRGRRGSRAVSAELLARALAAAHGRVWGELHRQLWATDHGPGVMVPLV